MAGISGRVAIVTGGARGIGAAFCLALASEGAKVLVTDVLNCDDTVEAIVRGGGEAAGVILDVSDFESCERAVQAAVSHFGALDIVVNNAALFTSIRRVPFDQLTAEEWTSVMAVNVGGPFNMAKAAIPLMKKRGYGKIVNISSGVVFAGTPGMLHYVTSKGAVLAFTRALAREVGPFGVCVNGIAPGLTMSEGIVAQKETLAPYMQAALATRSIKREQLPSDLTGALVFLSSKDSDFITGQTLVVDGGYIMN